MGTPVFSTMASKSDMKSEDLGYVRGAKSEPLYPADSRPLLLPFSDFTRRPTPLSATFTAGYTFNKER